MTGRLIRFGISGCTATIVNLGLLYILTEWVGIWYLLSAAVSFVVSFLVSFTLQKFWTFADRSLQSLHGQAAVYFSISIINLAFNTALLYLLVAFGHMHYLLAQVITSGFIAVESFFVYQSIIFTNPRGKALGKTYGQLYGRDRY